MSSNNDEHTVNTVRIQLLDKNNTITYKNKVTICMLSDGRRPLMYLRIKNDGTTVFVQEFSELQWLHESSMDGVAAICSAKTNIVIIYEAKNGLLVDFFARLQMFLARVVLEQKTTTVDSVSLQSNPAQIESMIDQLIKSIHSSASNEVEHITQELAKSRINVQFNLINKNENEVNNMAKSKSNSDVVESPDSVFRLLLRIECPLNKDPIIAPINVRSGTTLRSLKQQIEKETDIKCADQYWFAFDRYPISDDYIFGSSVSFVPNQNQQGSLVNPIRSDDMIIMYIAQMSPVPTGRAKNIRIRDDTNPQGIRNYANAKLQLPKKSISNVVIKISPDDAIVFEFKLDDCTYMDESSNPGSVECFRINSEQQTVIIIGPDEGCIELLDHIKDYLANKARRTPSPPPIKIQKQQHKPPQDKKVNELIGALNASNADKAATIARNLAEDRESIRFALDMINESGNTPVRQPPQPVVEPFRLKVSIETFLIDQGTDELYDVAILPKTTIKDLKQLIRQNANIDPNQQYWYINRELLDDNYTFDVKSTPRLNDKTVLILYITKPPNH